MTQDSRAFEIASYLLTKSN